nr:hypothetical protein [uncultured bacterium]
MVFLKRSENKNPEPKIDKNSEMWWQPGLNLFFQLSGWLVGPLVGALFLGRWLDDRYQTKPWLFLLSVGVAFLITCLGIIKETMEYIRQIEKEAKTKNLELTKKPTQGNDKQPSNQ